MECRRPKIVDSILASDVRMLNHQGTKIVYKLYASIAIDGTFEYRYNIWALNLPNATWRCDAMRGINTTLYEERISSNAYRLVALKCRVAISSDELDGW
jgi:hypothetical protein